MLPVQADVRLTTRVRLDGMEVNDCRVGIPGAADPERGGTPAPLLRRVTRLGRSLDAGLSRLPAAADASTVGCGASRRGRVEGGSETRLLQTTCISARKSYPSGGVVTRLPRSMLPVALARCVGCCRVGWFPVCTADVYGLRVRRRDLRGGGPVSERRRGVRRLCGGPPHASARHLPNTQRHGT
jgi:hypothetical protein